MIHAIHACYCSYVRWMIEVTDTLLSLNMLCSFALSFLLFHFSTKVCGLFSCLETSSIDLSTFSTMSRMVLICGRFFFRQSDHYWGFRTSNISSRWRQLSSSCGHHCDSLNVWCRRFDRFIRWITALSSRSTKLQANLCRNIARSFLAREFSPRWAFTHNVVTASVWWTRYISFLSY